MIKWIALASLALGPGCSVKSVGDLESDGGGTGSGGESSADTTASTSASASASGNSMTSASSDPTSVTDDASGDASGSDSSSGGCPGDSVCAPQPMDQQAHFTVDGEDDFVDSVLIDVPCTVSEVDGVGPTHIGLDCMEDGSPTTHTIDVHMHQILLLDILVGVQVRFSRVIIAPFWSEAYFTLRTSDGDLLIGGGHGSAIVPQDDFFAPFNPVLRDDVCAMELPCVDDGGFPACYVPQRTAIELDYGRGQTEVVLDGTSAQLGSTTYRVRVQESVMRHDIVCTDIPSRWYEWLIEQVTDG